MKLHKLLDMGIVGALIAAVCCFTFLLVLGLAGIGLGMLSGHANVISLPILAGIVTIVLLALWKRHAH